MSIFIKNLKGFFIAFLLFAVLTFFVSAAVRFSPAPEEWAIYYMIGALCVSCLFLGAYAGNVMKRKGLMYGTVYALIFLLILSAFFMLAFSSGIETGAGLIKYIIPVLFGSAGGMIGVNLNSR